MSRLPKGLSRQHRHNHTGLSRQINSPQTVLICKQSGILHIQPGVAGFIVFMLVELLAGMLAEILVG